MCSPLITFCTVRRKPFTRSAFTQRPCQPTTECFCVIGSTHPFARILSQPEAISECVPISRTILPIGKGAKRCSACERSVGVADKIISALSMLVIAISTAAHAANEWIGRASVIDADTIEIHCTKIRIYGIDAIEARRLCKHNGQEWNCAKDSAFALDDYLKGKVVTCKKSGRDSWKR